MVSRLSHVMNRWPRINLGLCLLFSCNIYFLMHSWHFRTWSKRPGTQVLTWLLPHVASPTSSPATFSLAHSAPSHWPRPSIELGPMVVVPSTLCTCCVPPPHHMEHSSFRDSRFCSDISFSVRPPPTNVVEITICLHPPYF